MNKKIKLYIYILKSINLWSKAGSRVSIAPYLRYDLGQVISPLLTLVSTKSNSALEGICIYKYIPSMPFIKSEISQRV